MLKRFIEWAENENWNITLESDDFKIPEQIATRYPLPNDWMKFIKAFRCCSNPEDTKWFLTLEDFQPRTDGFQWNEFELQSLTSAEGDDELKTSILAFWNKHLPIILSVDGEYSYYAINTENGNVVIGYEPEYEEADIVAQDFISFINKIITGEISL